MSKKKSIQKDLSDSIQKQTFEESNLPKNKFSQQIEDELKFWEKSLIEHNEQAKLYFDAFQSKIKSMEERAFLIQSSIQEKVSNLEQNKLKRSKSKIQSQNKSKWDELNIFYNSIENLKIDSLDKMSIPIYLKELIQECKIAKSDFKQLSNKKQSIEQNLSQVNMRLTDTEQSSEEKLAILNQLENSKLKKKDQIESLSKQKALTKAHIKECENKIKFAIQQEKIKAFEEFWETNNNYITKLINQIKSNPELKKLLDEIKIAKEEFKEILNRYKEQKLLIQNEMKEIKNSYIQFQFELDQISFPEKYKLNQSVSNSKLVNQKEIWPNHDLNPDSYLTEFAEKLNEKGLTEEYKSLILEDLTKCSDKDKNGNLKIITPTPYQKMVGYVLSPATDMRGLFLFYGVGSGKTACGIRSIAETINWHSKFLNSDIPKWCLVLLPNENLFFNWATDAFKFGSDIWGNNLKILDLNSSRPNTREWNFTFSDGQIYRIVLHKQSIKMPDYYTKQWNGKRVPPNNSLVIVDEVQNLVEPSKLSNRQDSQTYALEYGKAISNSILKVLVMTWTPLLDEDRISDLFKILNMVKQPGSKKRLPEGEWRPALTTAQQEDESISVAYQQGIEKETNLILKDFFDLEKGTWKEGMKRKFQLDHLGIVSFIHLENDRNVYPQIRTTGIPELCPDKSKTCDFNLVQDPNNSKSFKFNPYFRSFTPDEAEAIKSKDYRQIRTIRIGIPLSKSASNKFMTTIKDVSKMRKYYKLNCKSDYSYECIQWNNKTNPIGIGKGYSLKNYVNGKNKDYATKAVVLAQIINMYPNEKHFALTPARIYGDGPKSIVEYFEEIQNWETLNQSTTLKYLKMKDSKSNPNNPWANAVNLWYNENKTKNRLIYFGRLPNQDITSESYQKEKELYGEFVQKIYNDIRNNTGQYVKLFLGDRASAEGLNLFAGKHIYLLEPMSKAMKQQTLGRFLRYCAHYTLKPEQRFVNAYTFVATLDNQNKSNSNIDQVGVLTADQYIFDSKKSSFDPVGELYNAIAEVGVDCLLLKDYNQLGTCFPNTKSLFKNKANSKNEKTEEDEEISSLDKYLSKGKLNRNQFNKNSNSFICINPENPVSKLSFEELNASAQDLGLKMVESTSDNNLESICRSNGFLLDKSEIYSLEDEIVRQLLLSYGFEPQGNLESERRILLKDLAKISKQKYELNRKSKDKGIIEIAKDYAKSWWDWWNKKGESIKKSQDKTESEYYIIDDLGKAMIELNPLPLSFFEIKSNKKVKYDRASFDLASRILLHEWTNKPKLLNAVLKRLDLKDGSFILSYLEQKKYFWSETKQEEDIQSIETNAENFILKSFNQQLQQIQLENLKRKINLPNFKLSDSISKKVKSNL